MAFSFSPEKFCEDSVPLDELLVDSLYYPAAGGDVLPMSACLEEWHHLGIKSFVYCDALFDKASLKSTFSNFWRWGCEILGVRELKRSEYIPEGWSLNLYGIPKNQHISGVFADSRNLPGRAYWALLRYKGENLSLLYVTGEAFATYQQLYCARRVAPKMICFCDYHMVGGCQTDFESANCDFHRMIKANPESVPEWVVQGCHGELDGPIHCYKTESLGLRPIDYITQAEFDERYPNAKWVPSNMERPNYGYLTIDDGDRRLIGLYSYPRFIWCTKSVIIYEVTDNELDFERILPNMILAGVSRNMDFLDE